jgi:predicted nuclease of predicted toxin-antitoxin system
MSDTTLKFLIDVGVGKLVEQYLFNNGHEVVSVRDLDPRMPDEEIIKIAFDEDRIIITMDKDFGELVYHFSIAHAGVILLRLEDADGIEKTKVVSNILKDYSSQLKNSFCVYQNDKIRIRKFKK